MSAPYPYPTNDDAVGILSFFKYINVQTDGLFMPMIISIIWIVAFVAGRTQSAQTAFVFSTFLAMILSIIGAVLELISPKMMYLTIIVFCLGAVWIKLNK